MIAQLDNQFTMQDILERRRLNMWARSRDLSDNDNASVQEAFAAINSAFPGDAWGDWQDAMYNNMTSGNALNMSGVALYLPPNMKRGEDLPVQNTETSLTWIRNTSRLLCASSEYCVSALQNRINYAVNTGLVYRAIKGRPDCPESLVREAQQVIDFFHEVSDLSALEQETLMRMDIDGDAILRLFPADDGTMKVRFVEPEHLRAPNGDSSPQRSYGVETNPRDVEDIHGYWIVEDPQSNVPVYVPAEEVLHIKGGRVFRNSKRGRPLFHCVFTNIRRVEQIGSAISAIARARAKIALIRKLKSGTETAADKLREKVTAVRATDPVTGKERTIEDMKDGTILTSSENLSYEYPAANLGAADFIQVIDHSLRGIASAVNMPEWMLTANAQNMGAFASTLIEESPSTRSFQRLQADIRRFFGEKKIEPRMALVWRYLRHVVQCGLIDPMILTHVGITATAPSLTTRDKNQEANTNKTYHDLGVKSVETIQTELGLDPDEEAAKLAMEKPQQPEGEPQTPMIDESAVEALLLDGWVLDDGTERVMEAAPGLVAKKITVTTKKGTSYTKTVMVKPKEVAPKTPPKAEIKAVSQEAVAKAITDPKKITSKELAALPGHLGNLTVAQLSHLKKVVGAKGGGKKADIVEKIHASIAAKKNEKAKKEPVQKADGKEYVNGVEKDAAAQSADTKKIADTIHDFVHADTPSEHRKTFGATFDEIYQHAKKAHPNLTPEKFHDELIALHKAGKIRLDEWTKRTNEIPDHDLTGLENNQGAPLYRVFQGDGREQQIDVAKGKKIK